MGTLGDQFWMVFGAWVCLGGAWGRGLGNDKKTQTFGCPLSRLWEPLGGHWVTFGNPWTVFGDLLRQFFIKSRLIFRTDLQLWFGPWSTAGVPATRGGAPRPRTATASSGPGRPLVRKLINFGTQAGLHPWSQVAEKEGAAFVN